MEEGMIGAWIRYYELMEGILKWAGARKCECGG